VIGQSWTALFLAAGKSVTLYEPDPAAASRVRENVATVWPTLVSLGSTDSEAPPDELVLCDTARAAVEGAQFVQESVPERLDVKHELYAEIEPVLDDTAVVASSSSGLTLTELQGGWRDPARLVLGHPFKPPHLIPLVEVMGNEQTAPGVVARARGFYESLGKVTIELKREVPGHVANRLQAALWREAIHLINEGVASVDDIDTAVSSGPGLRWALMGPTLLFHLNGGEGGLAAFCERYGDSFNRWWDDLGRPHLDQATADRLLAGLSSARMHGDIEILAAKRDRLLTALIAATQAEEGPASDPASATPKP
jgi:3-hydroxyacyl-CoA dehydrogenase